MRTGSKGKLKVVLCVDNDPAGQEFIQKVKGTEIDYTLCQPYRDYKDWNEQVKDMKKQGKIIARLIQRERDSLRFM